MAKQITKKLELDIDQVDEFFEEYDHWGSIGWLTEIVNGNIDLDLMRQAVWCHSVGNNEKCQKLVDKMFITKWWEK
jgi:hypothetical protein